MVFYQNCVYPSGARSDDWAEAVEETMSIFKNDLKLTRVHKYGELSKGQMIEKLEHIKGMAAAFEKRKSRDPSLWNSVFFVAVAFIGWGIDVETDHE